MPSTRSARSATALDGFLNNVLPVMTDWLAPKDVANLQLTCKAANAALTVDDSIWKALAIRYWPDVGELVVKSGQDLSPGKYKSYRALFLDWPRVWLTMEAARIRKTVPQWTELEHINERGRMECGKCGCNCSNEDECPGIPITTKYRYDRLQQLDYYDRRTDCPDGEGYEMSGGTLVALNHFCEPCFERMVELKMVEQKDYEKVAGTNLFDATTDFIIKNEGKDAWRYVRGYQPEGSWEDERLRCFHCDTFFTYLLGEGMSWQKWRGVTTDDALIVVANALIDPACRSKHLNLDGLHYNERFSKRAYKALAYALSINTSLVTLTIEAECECHMCDEPRLVEDGSNGLLEKALQHNTSHNLVRIDFCWFEIGEMIIKLKLNSLLKSPSGKRKRT